MCEGALLRAVDATTAAQITEKSVLEIERGPGRSDGATSAAVAASVWGGATGDGGALIPGVGSGDGGRTGSRASSIAALHSFVAAATAATARRLAAAPRCVAWRTTFDCSFLGRRLQLNDADCDAVIKIDTPGFCECAGGRIAATSGCGHAPFTCYEACDSPYPGAHGSDGGDGGSGFAALPYSASPGSGGGGGNDAVTDARVRQKLLAFRLAPPECVAFRATGLCDPFGPREPHHDRACSEARPIGQASGHYKSLILFLHGQTT